MNENKQPLALTFMRRLAERQLDEAITSGQVQKRAIELAIERGGRRQEYLLEAQEEFEKHYFEPVLEMEAREKDYREFEQQQEVRLEAERLDVPLSPASTVETEEKNLDQRTHAYAEKHGVSYSEALSNILEEG